MPSLNPRREASSHHHKYPSGERVVGEPTSSQPPQPTAEQREVLGAACQRSMAKLFAYNNQQHSASTMSVCRTKFIGTIKSICKWRPLSHRYFGCPSLVTRCSDGCSPFSTRRHTSPWSPESSSFKSLGDMPMSPQPFVNMAKAWNRVAQDYHEMVTSQSSPAFHQPPRILPLKDCEYKLGLAAFSAFVARLAEMSIPVEVPLRCGPAYHRA